MFLYVILAAKLVLSFFYTICCDSFIEDISVEFLENVLSFYSVGNGIVDSAIWKFTQNKQIPHRNWQGISMSTD